MVASIHAESELSVLSDDEVLTMVLYIVMEIMVQMIFMQIL